MCNPVVALSHIADAIAVLFVQPLVYLYRASALLRYPKPILCEEF